MDRRILMFVAALGAAACKREPSAALVRSETEPSGAAAGATPGARANLSDFDLAMRVNGALQVPRGFNALVARLEQRAKGSSVVTLVPYGRSLVRGASTIASPRVVGVVVTPDGARLDPGDIDAATTPIFYGFSRMGDSFEVISFNHGAGRWEYQVVEGLSAAAGQPAVKYARRAQCVACHKAEAPLFPGAPWLETLNNGQLVADIRAALGAGDDRDKAVEFEGVTVAGESDELSPRAIETAADLGAKVVFRQDVWARVCAGDGQCRADLVARAASEVLSLTPDERRELEASRWYLQADTRFAERARASVNGKATFRGAVIADRDPLLQRELTPATDPLRIEAPAAEVTFDGLEAAMSHGFKQLFTAQDGAAIRAALAASGEPKVGKALETWSSGWATRSWAQTAGALDRCVILKDLFPSTPPPGCVWGESGWRAAESGAAMGGAAALSAFVSHCGDCHEAGTPPAFVAEEETAMEPLFRTWAHCIVKSLDWEAPGSRQMPPTERARRELAGRGAEKAQMLATARIAAEEMRVDRATRQEAEPPCPSSAGVPTTTAGGVPATTAPGAVMPTTTAGDVPTTTAPGAPPATILDGAAKAAAPGAGK